MQIRSLQGQFSFRVQQLKNTVTGQYTNWLLQEGYFQRGTYVSKALQAHSCWLGLHCSYEVSSKILEKQLGSKVLSDQSIYRFVKAKAAEVSASEEQLVLEKEASLACEETGGALQLATDIDLYTADSKEIILMEDGIQVKGQKQHRCSKNRLEVSDAGKNKRWITDVVSLQQPDGTFRHFMNDLQGRVDLSRYIRYQCQTTYGTEKGPLKIVSIIDGASTIRKHLQAAFNGKVTYILDWYHLRKKCNALLSMIAHGKAQRKEWAKTLLSFCWKGQIAKGIAYIKAIEEVRNEIKHKELLDYLIKHRQAIIHYEKRKKAGKTIGSGRMEATVNEVVGRRQKDNGMAWSQIGSRALALLQIAQMNGQWEQIWAI